MKKLLGETIIYGIGAILPRIILVILNYIFIKHIDNSAFASFANLYAIISYINVILSFGFETSYFRFSADKEQEPLTFNTALWLLVGLSSLFLTAVLLFKQPISGYLGYSQNPEYIVWFALIAFFDNLCVIPLAWLRFHNKPIKYTAVKVIQSVFQSIFVIALFLYIPENFIQKFGLKEKVSYPFFSNLMASILGFLMIFPIFIKIRPQFSVELVKKMIPYSLPIMIAGLAFMVNENYDKTVQKGIISDADAGSYGGCYKMAVLMTLFVTAYRMGIEPYFFKQMKSENAKNTYAKVTEYFSFFASVVAMGIIANISWLKLLLVPNKDYWNALNIVPIIVIANLCFGIYYNLSTWYKVTDRTKYGTIISWFGAGVTIILHFLFLKQYGFMVSAWTTFIAYFLMMILSYFLGQKYYPIPYRIGKIAFFLGLLMVFSFVEATIFNYNIWVGNLMLLIYTAILAFSEKDFILSKIKAGR